MKTKAPKGDLWLHEIKYDSYRVQFHLKGGRKKVFTRSGLDWTKRFTEIAGALAKATWVEPEFTAEIEYPDITSEGLLRQSAFKGLNRD